MSKVFKPMLFPNESVTPEDIKRFPMIGSYKLDGIRCIFKDGEMLSRSLKPIPNKQLNERFQYMKSMSRATSMIYDGEIYSEDLTFQQITHFVMTKDLDDPKTHKKLTAQLKKGTKEGTLKEWTELPWNLDFYWFDTTSETLLNEPYSRRLPTIHIMPHTRCVAHKKLYKYEEVTKYFEEALAWGYEGIMLRCPDSQYKFGRYTVNSGDGYKFKPFRTFDAQVIGFVQGTKVNPNAEVKTNELGRSVTSKKLGDRIPIESCSGLVVKYKGMDITVTLAMTMEEKAEIWANRDNYLGRMIEYKGMLIGAKNVPRHPVFVRYREDKNA